MQTMLTMLTVVTQNSRVPAPDSAAPSKYVQGLAIEEARIVRAFGLRLVAVAVTYAKITVGSDAVPSCYPPVMKLADPARLLSKNEHETHRENCCEQKGPAVTDGPFVRDQNRGVADHKHLVNISTGRLAPARTRK